MPIVYEDRIQGSARNVFEVPSSTSEVLTETFAQAYEENPIAAVRRYLALREDERTGPRLNAETARARLKDAGMESDLTIGEGGITEAALVTLMERKRVEKRRQETFGLADGGIGQGAAKLGVAALTSLVDPVSAGLNFVPVMGQARYAKLLAGAGGMLGRAGVRAGVGAAEGAVGAAMVEPFIYAMRTQEQADYDAVDSLLNVTLGGFVGAGLHTTVGSLGELYGHLRPQVDPEILRLPREHQQTLTNMYRTAGEAKPNFDAAMNEIAVAAEGRAVLPDLKGTKRAADKIIAEYGGDPKHIKDIVRGTIEVSEVGQASRAIEGIKQRFEVLPTGSRNWLDPAVETADGYRDAKFNVRLRNGAIGEVQVNVPEMMAVKEKLHVAYEQREAIVRKIGAEQRVATAKEASTVAGLNAKMKSAYDAAWAAVLARDTSASKSASASATPLRTTDSAGKSLGGSESHAFTPGSLVPTETGTPSTSKNITAPPTLDSVAESAQGRLAASQQVASMTTQNREVALRAAVAQAVAGEPINIAPIFGKQESLPLDTEYRAATQAADDVLANPLKESPDELPQTASELADLAEADARETAKRLGVDIEDPDMTDVAEAIEKAERWARAAELATVCLVRGG